MKHNGIHNDFRRQENCKKDTNVSRGNGNIATKDLSDTSTGSRGVEGLHRAAVLIFFFTIALTPVCSVGQTTVHVNGVSKHVLMPPHPEQGRFNEWNVGIGISRPAGEHWQVQTGVFRNSFFKWSVYGAAYRSLREVGPIQLGVTVGAATGYGEHSKLHWRIVPMAVPTVSAEWITIYTLPPFITALQLNLN